MFLLGVDVLFAEWAGITLYNFLEENVGALTSRYVLKLNLKRMNLGNYSVDTTSFLVGMNTLISHSRVSTLLSLGSWAGEKKDQVCSQNILKRMC